MRRLDEEKLEASRKVGAMSRWKKAFKENGTGVLYADKKEIVAEILELERSGINYRNRIYRRQAEFDKAVFYDDAAKAEGVVKEMLLACLRIHNLYMTFLVLQKQVPVFAAGGDEVEVYEYDPEVG